MIRVMPLYRRPMNNGPDDLERRMFSLLMWSCVGMSLIFTCILAVALPSLRSSSQQAEAKFLASDTVDNLARKRPGAWTPSDIRPLHRLAEHPEVAFVAVFLEDGKCVFTDINDPGCWNNYNPANSSGAMSALSGFFLRISKHFSVQEVVPTFADAPPPASVGTLRSVDVVQKPKVTVALGMREPSGWRFLGMLLAIDLSLAMGLFVIAKAMLRLHLARWRRPLKQMVHATRLLAESKSLEPVEVTSNDEVGMLSTAFNDMASKLQASQRELLESNQTLDGKVRERTQQLLDAVHKLDSMAITDALTGLLNRRGFMQELEQNFNSSVRTRAELACIMIDLDGFKGVNDTLGHKAGDEILALMTDVLKEGARNTDVRSRLGGDEFAILIEHADMAQVMEVAGRIRADFEAAAAKWFVGKQMILPVSMSVGVAGRKRDEATTTDDLMQKADTALYAAKRGGKARVVSYDTLNPPTGPHRIGEGGPPANSTRAA